MSACDRWVPEQPKVPCDVTMEWLWLPLTTQLFIIPRNPWEASKETLSLPVTFLLLNSLETLGMSPWKPSECL